MRLLSCFSLARAQVMGFLFLFSALPVFAADQTPDQLSLQDRVYIATRVYASLSYFAHWQNVPHLDLDDAYRSYLGKALASPDRTAFTHVTMEFLAGFHNGHTVFVDMPLVLHGGALPFVAEVIDGKWVVTQSSSAGLNPGDVVERIDGRDFGAFVADTMRLVSSSTVAGGQHALFGRMLEFAPYAHQTGRT